MRNLLSLTLAVVLSACATAQTDQTASLQNAVYVAGDGAAPVQATAAQDSSKSENSDDRESPLRQLYWFLSGR